MLCSQLIIIFLKFKINIKNIKNILNVLNLTVKYNSISLGLSAKSNLKVLGLPVEPNPIF